MMFSNEELLRKWNNLTYHSNSYTRIDSEHPLEWNIGYENINQKSLLLVSDFEPVKISSSKSIVVAIGQRTDGKWALSLRLIRSEQEDVFIRLCCDLIESSRNQTNNINGLEFVLQRYNQWAKLMEVQQTGLLSEARQKGLVGELHFLQQLILNGKPILDAINGWIGPEGADQDFVYSNGWYEVKTLGIGAKTVSISSLEQFDAKLPGELILYFIDKTSNQDVQGITLNNKVSQIRECILTSNVAYNLFNDKLLRYGYIDIPEYGNKFYRIGGEKRFFVGDDFPRLVKENVPSQVVAVEYQLSIQAIEQWKID